MKMSPKSFILLEKMNRNTSSVGTLEQSTSTRDEEQPSHDGNRSNGQTKSGYAWVDANSTPRDKHAKQIEIYSDEGAEVLVYSSYRSQASEKWAHPVASPDPSLESNSPVNSPVSPLVFVGISNPSPPFATNCSRLPIEDVECNQDKLSDVVKEEEAEPTSNFQLSLVESDQSIGDLHSNTNNNIATTVFVITKPSGVVATRNAGRIDIGVNDKDYASTVRPRMARRIKHYSTSGTRDPRGSLLMLAHHNHHNHHFDDSPVKQTFDQLSRIGQELIDTERNFCKTLRLVLANFADPLIKSDKDWAILFPASLHSIYTLHSALLFNMELVSAKLHQKLAGPSLILAMRPFFCLQVAINAPTLETLVCNGSHQVRQRCRQSTINRSAVVRSSMPPTASCNRFLLEPARRSNTSLMAARKSSDQSSDKTAFARYYTRFITDYGEIRRLTTTTSKSDRKSIKLRSMMKTVIQPSCNGMDVAGFLLAPIKRLSHYLLLCQRVKRHLASSNGGNPTTPVTVTDQLIVQLDALLSHLDASIGLTATQGGDIRPPPPRPIPPPQQQTLPPPSAALAKPTSQPPRPRVSSLRTVLAKTKQARRCFSFNSSMEPSSASAASSCKSNDEKVVVQLPPTSGVGGGLWSQMRRLITTNTRRLSRSMSHEQHEGAVNESKLLVNPVRINSNSNNTDYDVGSDSYSSGTPADLPIDLESDQS